MLNLDWPIISQPASTSLLLTSESIERLSNSIRSIRARKRMGNWILAYENTQEILDKGGVQPKRYARFNMCIRASINVGMGLRTRVLTHCRENEGFADIRAYSILRK